MRGFISRALTILGGFFIIYGIFLLVLHYNPTRLSFYSYPQSTHSKSTSQTIPAKLVIRDLSIDLPIYPAQIHKGTWETINDGVSYLVYSPLPGTPGNSIFYGHNWTSVLGSLPKIRPGEIVQVVYNNGSKKSFLVTGTAIVTPDQTHILKNTKDTRITIYTCTGFLDSKRFVVTAVSVDSHKGFSLSSNASN